MGGRQPGAENVHPSTELVAPGDSIKLAGHPAARLLNVEKGL